MAKIRVYELAKDLNMTNKELLDKVRDLNIEVSSHMSSIDDEVVTKIKSELSCLDNKVDEKRIHSTVIRRRRKADKVLNNSIDISIENSESLGIIEPSDTRDSNKSADDFNSADNSSSNTLPIIEKPSFVTNKIAKSDSKPESIGSVPDKISSKIERPVKIVKLKETSSMSENTNDISNHAKLNRKEHKKSVFYSSDIKTSSKNYFKKNKNDFSKDVMLSKVNKNSEDSKIKKKKIKKKSFFKKTKHRDTPAKIIKKANDSKVESLKKVISDQVVLPKRKAIINEIPVPKVAERKDSKKRKTYKKREVVEGAALYSGKKRNRRVRKGSKSKLTTTGQKTQITVAKAIKRRVKIDEAIVLADFAKRLGIKANEMIAKLMSMGVMVTVNQTIDFDTACLVAAEFNYEIERASFEEEVILKRIDKDIVENMVERPPVVTIMGHVDHGKTSLLDAIRETRVTEREAGGITQHIGAYRVKTKKGIIVFLDTPGHEAFSAMRSRGAKVTDLVVLVVAADDGVMLQTVEAINHSKIAKVPVIVAINKMDKMEANPDRVLRELSEHGLVAEEWGGDLIVVKVSAKQNDGIDNLLEMILLQAEMLELKANPDKLARGHVVESKLDSGRGSVATVLVQEGTLRSGDSVVCGIHYGKVRALHDDIGCKVEYAGPSMPVEIIGLSGVPMAGDELVALKDEKDARQVSIHRIQKQRSKELAKSSRLSLEGLFEKMKKGEVKDLNIIIKADVDGSIEALKSSLVKLSNEEVTINIIHSATGTISESDIPLAAVSSAIIIGFNVRPNGKVQDFALNEGVDIRFYDVIYNVIKDVKDAIVGMMDSTYEEQLLGRADVRQFFHVPKVGTVAGCYVTYGKISRGKLMRLLRDGVVIYQGKNSSLRRFKDDVKEVKDGYECGISIENFNDIKVGDVIESYFMKEIKPEI